MFFCEPLFKLLDEIGERNSKAVANHFELDHVHSSFAALDLADTWLFEEELSAKLLLRESRSLPGLDEKLQEDRVFFCVNALPHHTDRVNAKVVYAKMACNKFGNP